MTPAPAATSAKGTAGTTARPNLELIPKYDFEPQMDANNRECFD
jgi:hypothetical protein